MAIQVWRRPFVWAGNTKWHEFLYDAQAVFKIVAGLALGLTLLVTFNSWPGALFFAAVFVVSWILWMAGTILEHRARKRLHGPTTEGEYLDQLEAEELGSALGTQRAIERRAAAAGMKLGLEIFAGLVLLAVVFAAILFDRRTLGIGMILVFACLVLFGAPVWAAAIHEKLSEERERGGK
jgi:hypothetical protein